MRCVLGGVGGIAVLTLLAVGWSIFSYCRYGDDTWEIVIERDLAGELVQLVCKGEVLARCLRNRRQRDGGRSCLAGS